MQLVLSWPLACRPVFSFQLLSAAQDDSYYYLARHYRIIEYGIQRTTQDHSMLGRIPVEVLDGIFAELAEFDTAYLRRVTFYRLSLVCRAVHHPACRWLYREIKFEHDPDPRHYSNGCLDFSRLLLFLRTVEASEERGLSGPDAYPYNPQPYGMFVHHLSVTIDLGMRELKEQNKTRDCRNLELVMERLLRRTPNVQTLIISVWAEDRGEDVRLADCHQFQHLTDLRITTDVMTFLPWIFQPPNLKRVSVDSGHIFEVGTWPRLPSSVIGFWLAHPPLHGATVNDVLTSPARLETFGYVESLGPYNSYGDLKSIEVVTSFLHPIHGTLKRLNLDSCKAPDIALSSPVLVYLSAFSALEYLSLSGSWLPRITRGSFSFPRSLREIHFLCGRVPVPHTVLREDRPQDAQHDIEAVLKFVSLKSEGILPRLKVVTFTESVPLAHSRHIVVDSALPKVFKKPLRKVNLRFVCRFMVPGCLARRVPGYPDLCPSCRLNSMHWKEDAIVKGRVVDFPTHLTTSLAWPPSEW